ncbi:hypothetical protein JCM12298_19360 [Desulfothermus naphthae]
MPIVTISRGSYSKGKEIAEKLAKRLGYECISRDVIIEASKEFNIPEIKLIKALHDPPSILERFTYGKERYIAYIRYALLNHVKKDNVVYHGVAGHFFLQGIPHVVKVRIIANLEERVKIEMERENISADKAKKLIKKYDEARKKWAKALYGIDTNDPKLYDVIFHIDTLKVEDIVELLEQTVKRPCFQSTELSQKIFENKYIEAKIVATLVDLYPHITAYYEDDKAHIVIKDLPHKKQQIEKKIEEIFRKDVLLKNIDFELVVNSVDSSIPD